MVLELNEFTRAIIATDINVLDGGQILTLIGGQLLPVIPLLLNSFVLQHLSL
jgi:hypothetical protein